jgi:hypothetical protein
MLEIRATRAIAVTIAIVSVLTLVPHVASGGPPTYCALTSDFFPGADTVLHGDVDGDGATDTVSTHARITPDGSCRARLIVETDQRIYRTKVAPLTGLMLVPPALAGLVHLRPGHRLDIAVIVWLGASTGFLDVYGLHGRRLHQVSPQAYSYAGSFGERSGVDCDHRRGARLVASWASADRKGRHYIGERDFYSIRGGSLRPVPRLAERFRISIDSIDRFPELASPVPFPSCTIVRGAS